MKPFKSLSQPVLCKYILVHELKSSPFYVVFRPRSEFASKPDSVINFVDVDMAHHVDISYPNHNVIIYLR